MITLSKMIFLYTPCKDISEAKKIAQALITKRVAACANIFPISSIYRWKGKIIDDQEQVLLIKTTEDKAKKARDEIKKLHSYEVPCVASFKVDCNRDYQNWIEKEVEE